MVISLYLNDRIINYRLPSVVSGSFTFDFEEKEGSLINIDAYSGKWFLYSTSYAKVLNGDKFIDRVELISNNFYAIMRDGLKYLIYVYNSELNNIIAYKYENNANITIGNDQSATIYYNLPLLSNKAVQISKENDFVINNDNIPFPIYVNKVLLKYKKYTIKIGDVIEIYGLRLMFLKDLILINNLREKVTINEVTSRLTTHTFEADEEAKEIEVKNVDLYKKTDYYSKSPRLRRLIETKVVKLAQPPRDGNNSSMPLLLVIGPMLTMGLTSVIMITNNLNKISAGETTFAKSWPQLLTSLVMIVSVLVWPLATRFYNKKAEKRRRKELKRKYTKYLDRKRKELDDEAKEQTIILYENLLTIENCLDILQRKNINFWDKRVDQNDFLTVRIGMGDELLDVKIEYSEEDFKIDENDLRDEADKLVSDYKYLKNVPIGYSLYDCKITDIMGNKEVTTTFVHNLLLQLITFYSYEDLKIVLFTDETRKKEWEYIRYLNHNFSNIKDFRFFASDIDSAKMISEYLDFEINNRVNNQISEPKPYYLIIIDDYDNVRQLNFIKKLTEIDENIGFSILIIENSLSKLPSKCNNFIMLDGENSVVLKNSYEKQEKVKFIPEIHYGIDMMQISKSIANIPIEFDDSFKNLPDAITFLEMEKVGKVEQLNILNRWNNNDSTASLRAEVGVNEDGDLMYLDLHEKYHGPHGLIAGMTGSGKSEFIITYILSMAINYSPDDVAFILIDYKGGGLAYAFENKATGAILPHLTGTITNLDKSEIARTLVSIDSEIKRRQEKFNIARDRLGESTLDIYKYQKFYKEGKIDEAIPHLFIICDEFAELKSQQPEFMDNLISVARIGRSLGVHLILATQKPSGVVNEQIWSNTKFRVCLKVQDESDSKEMLKRPEAASLKQTGRFYLQVGFDEYFALGQSGWCGAKYYPSDKIIKNVDKSLNFINDCGLFIKSIQASSNINIKPQGEQLSVILNSIIDISRMVNKKARRLWLENISAIVTIDDLEKKYNYVKNDNDIETVLGEYDAPEKQMQGLVTYNYLKDGNTIIYGNDSSEIEMLLNTMIYSTSKHFSSEQVNYYVIDYGSESFRKFLPLPHMGGVVFASDDEEYTNLLKMLKEEIQYRKNLFVNYGGEYQHYIKNSDEKLPIKVVIINNYDSLYSTHQDIYDVLPDLIRDSERYGIVFILTGSSVNSIHSKIAQACSNIYAFKLKDQSDYATIFGKKVENPPADILGRGVLKHDITHIFQVASITSDTENLNEYLMSYIQNLKNSVNKKAKMIPVLPNKIRLKNVQHEITSLKNIPVGISKKELEVYNMDFITNPANIISANRINNTENFVTSLLTIYSYFSNIYSIVIDPNSLLTSVSSKFKNYFTDNYDKLIDYVINNLEQYIENKSNVQGVIFIYGLNKFVTKVNDNMKLTKFFKLIKEYEKISVIVVDSANQLKQYVFESWFTGSFSTSDGIWVGKGLADQSIFRVSTIKKEMTQDYKNDMGYIISEGSATLCKLIDFVSPDE